MLRNLFVHSFSIGVKYDDLPRSRIVALDVFLLSAKRHIAAITDRDRIEFLIDCKFPYLRDERNPIQDTDEPLKPPREIGLHVPSKPVGQINELIPYCEDIYRSELESKPHKELLALYELKKEEQRFFNHPDAYANDAVLGNWSIMPYWTLDEGVALAFGTNPKIVTWEKVKVHIKPYYSSPFALEYDRRREWTLRADCYNEPYDQISPGSFIEWAKGKNIIIPCELLEQLAANGISIDSWKESNEKLKKRYKELEELYDEQSLICKELTKLVELLAVNIRNNQLKLVEDDDYGERADKIVGEMVKNGEKVNKNKVSKRILEQPHQSAYNTADQT